MRFGAWFGFVLALSLFLSRGGELRHSRRGMCPPPNSDLSLVPSTVGNLQGLPYITVGVTGSGAAYTPGTNSTPGDTAPYTDIAYALQAAFTAATSAPYSTSYPAAVTLLPGNFPMWNTLSTPKTIYFYSSGQTFLGVGKASSRITPKSAGSATLTPVSAAAYPGSSYAGQGYSVSQYVMVTPNTETSGSATCTGQTLVAYSGASGSQVTGIYILGTADTVTVTYAGGTPKMYAALPMFAFNLGTSAGSPTYATPGPGFVFQDFEVNCAAGIDWADTIDCSISPTTSGATSSTGKSNGAAYYEQGNSARIMGVRLAVADTIGTVGIVTAFMGDGIEQASYFECDGADWHVCTPRGFVSFWGCGDIGTMTVMGQVVTLGGQSYNAPITIANISAAGDQMSETTSPCQIQFLGGGADGQGSSGNAFDVTVLQSTEPTYISFYGGWYKSAGTRTNNGFINAAPSIASQVTINIFGGTYFQSGGNLPLINNPPAAVNIYGPVMLGASPTAAQFLANTALTGNPTAALAGYAPIMGMTTPFFGTGGSWGASTPTPGTYQMMGLGDSAGSGGLSSPAIFTPVAGKRLKVVIVVTIKNQTAADGVSLQGKFGTTSAGTGPVQGAASTGTQFGSTRTDSYVGNASTTTTVTLIGYFNATAGTQYWVDLAMTSVTGGNVTLSACDVAIEEVIV
jgi:hypothetical protein